MNISMTPALVLFLAASLPFVAMAQDVQFAPVAASEVVLADLLYLKRPIVVFADSPNDPDYIFQMSLLAKGAADLAFRDVIVITDTTLNPASELRQKLRPRGFLMVLLDKDGSAEQRKPLPWDVREISRAIDKFPSRRDELLTINPAGR